MRTGGLLSTMVATASAITIAGSTTKLTPLVKGRPTASSPVVSASELWKKQGAIVFAVRRPG